MERLGHGANPRFVCRDFPLDRVGAAKGLLRHAEGRNLREAAREVAVFLGQIQTQ